MLKRDRTEWTTDDSTHLYGVGEWGDGFFRISRSGRMTVRPSLDHDATIDLTEVVNRLQANGAELPLLIRFDDLLESRVRRISDAFATAIEDCRFRGRYRCVFPVKVNQQRHVVERILKCGRPLGFGVEVGSKAELLAVVAISDNETPIVCNGFKDARYIETALLATKLGRNLTIVIEKSTELSLIMQLAARYSVHPQLGIRMKLAARGAGRWQASGGYDSKFGLTVGEILTAVEDLQRAKLQDCLHLLHFHVGSQITDIRHIKAALIEATRVYAHLVEAGVALKCIDCGGGLGVDYDGSQSANESSMNYSLQEYANDVVYYIQEVCNDHGVAHPDIITESGRAITAHSSVLVVNVLGVASQVNAENDMPLQPVNAAAPQPLRTLQTALEEVNADNLTELYHDGQHALDMAASLFAVGHLTLQQRREAERQFWLLCRRIKAFLEEMENAPDELSHIHQLLTDTYFCNFSVFQSLPDSWALDHLFPVAPIHRLEEKPDRSGVLGDITCDSLGKLSQFSLRGVCQKSLPLHSLRESEPYYLGVFLVGAYQETLGEYHNLFGDTNTAHISLTPDGEVSIDAIIKGDCVSEVLHYAQFDAEQLQADMQIAIGDAVGDGRLQPSDAARFRKLYVTGLAGYTYLEETYSDPPVE